MDFESAADAIKANSPTAANIRERVMNIPPKFPKSSIARRVRTRRLQAVSQ